MCKFTPCPQLLFLRLFALKAHAQQVRITNLIAISMSQRTYESEGIYAAMLAIEGFSRLPCTPCFAGSICTLICLLPP